jgi:hypothetical protein
MKRKQRYNINMRKLRGIKIVLRGTEECAIRNFLNKINELTKKQYDDMRTVSGNLASWV